MARRRASQPELQALHTTTLAITLLAWHWAPGITAAPAAILTYYALLTGATVALRWDTGHAIAGAHLLLRTTTAHLIRAAAWLITALATATLHALATAHRHTLPTTPAT